MTLSSIHLIENCSFFTIVVYKLINSKDCYKHIQVTPAASLADSSAESDPEDDFEEIDGGQDLELKEQQQSEVWSVMF